MLFRSADVTVDELERVSGWRLRPAGLCREERCVPFAARDADRSARDAARAAREAGRVALADVAAALGSPLVHDARHGLWALGAESGGHALSTASAPDLELPDADGHPFRLASLRGRKVLLVAWASW